MYLCKKEINPEEPCPSGLNSNERLCISKKTELNITKIIFSQQ